MKIAVLADDLSGAAELAARAKGYGLRVDLTRMAPPGKETEVWICDTSTRDAGADKAAAAVKKAAEWIPCDASLVLFKKIDSILRGHPAVECEALAASSGKTKIQVAPGNPSLGRYVEDGKLWVEGCPLHKTAFAQEAAFRIESSGVDDLWKREKQDLSVPVDFLEVGKVSDLSLRSPHPLPETLYAGGVDYFEAFLQNECGEAPARRNPRPAPSSMWVVCGSQTGWTAREALFTQKGWPVAVLAEFPAKLPTLVLAGFGKKPSLPVKIEDLASAVAKRIRISPPEMLCLEGGSTAAAVFEAMNWRNFHCEMEWEAGVSELWVEDLPLRILIKPGSYAWPEALFASHPTKV